MITNYHLIQGASSAEIKITDGETYPVNYILAGDEQRDLVWLSVNISSQSIYPLPLSQIIPEVGERIFVYSNPLELEDTVSNGIVTAIRDIPDYGRVIEITAHISPDSSGSPVLNLQGEAIEIVATFQSIEGQKLNFAIPSEKITSLILTEVNKLTITKETLGSESQTKKDSEYVEAYKKAVYFIEEKEYEKALLFLEIAIKTEILSLKAYVYFAIGICNNELDNYIKAIEAFKQEIRIDPNYAAVYHNLGLAYNVLGLYNDAIKAYREAIRIAPYYASAYYGLGLSYLKIVDKDLALDEYKILKELDIDLANKLYDLIYK